MIMSMEVDRLIAAENFEIFADMFVCFLEKYGRLTFGWDKSICGDTSDTNKMQKVAYDGM